MPFWKLLVVPVAVMLIALAYAAGALTGGPTPPEQQPPILLQDVGDRSSPTQGTGKGTDGPGKPRPESEDPSDGTREDPPEVEDDDDDDEDDVRVVIPEPTEVHDEDDDDGRDDRDDAD